MWKNIPAMLQVNCTFNYASAEKNNTFFISCPLTGFQ
jgi:hypothetical protein